MPIMQDDSYGDKLGTRVNTSLTDFGNEAFYRTNAYSWEPKKQHQFILSIPDTTGAAAIPAYLIKTSAKPTISNSEITLDHINVQRYVKGKSVWNSIAVQLYDPIEPSAAGAVIEWVRLHHESATGRDGYSNMYKKTLTLQQLSPIGEVIEEWQMVGAFITEANFGSLDWSAEDVVMIDLTLRYDYAFLKY